MINTVCVSIFKTLSESEVKAFGNYLAASYQKSGSIYKLYNYLKKNHPDLPEQKLTRKIVEKKLFKEKADPERTLFDATSKITAKLKNFITTQELEQHEVYQNFLYLEALKSRKLDELFFKKADSLQKKWDDDSIPGIEHLHNLYKLKVLNYSHPNISNLNSKTEVKKIIYLLDQYYVTSKLYYTLINDVNNNESKNDKFSIGKILENCNGITFPHNTRAKLMHDFILTYQSNDFKDLMYIKSTFFKLHHHFTQSEKHDLVDILKYLFYSKLYSNQDEADTNKELFEIVKFSLKEDLLLEDGYLSNQSYINCILFARSNNAINWIEKFIKKYKNLLNEKDKDDCVMFSQIILDIEKKKYEAAIEKISLIRIRKPVRLAQLNCCKLQCYYELNYEEPFYNAVSAANQYLLNHKDDFSDLHLDLFKGFTKIIKKIYKLKVEFEIKPTITKNNSDKNLYVFLNYALDLKNPLYDRKWLVLKIKEILKKIK